MINKKTKSAIHPAAAFADATQVAKLAGVSIVTVSRALNNSSVVSPATRDKVLAAASELNYRPNPVARALRTQKSNSVALVLNPLHLSGPFYAELLAGFHGVIHQRSMSVMLAVAPTDTDLLKWLYQNLRGAALDGVVLHSEVVREIGIPAFSSLQIPAVVAGMIEQGRNKTEISCVGYNHTDAVQQCVRYLIALGHRHIAWLDTPQTARPISREATFRKEMANAKLTVREEWIYPLRVDDEPAVGAEAIQALLSRRPPFPTAVLCGTDLIAAGVIDGARRWGRAVPEELSVIGYGDGPWAPVVIPALTSVHQRGADLGAALGQKLLDRIDGVASGYGFTALPMPLVIRGSTARPGPAK